ncbi:MAG: histidine phosphatase family protein [Verrucomicrobiota bacterium]
MKTVVFIRHAKSSWNNPGLDDFARPLNDRGERDAPLAADRLKQFGIQPDYMVSSPAKRARTTAEVFAETLGFPEEMICWNEALYLCSPHTWLEVLQNVSDEKDVIVTFGDNPGITSMVNELTNSNIDNIPTAGLAVVEFQADSWNTIDWRKGTLAWFDYPKLHP